MAGLGYNSSGGKGKGGASDSLAAMEAAMSRLTKGQSAVQYKHIKGFNPLETRTVPQEDPSAQGPVNSIDDLHKRQAMAAAAKAAASIALNIPAAPAAPAPAAASAAPAAPAAGAPRVRKRRGFTEGPVVAKPANEEQPSATDGTLSEKDQVKIDIAAAVANATDRAAKRAKRKSKWDIAGPDAVAGALVDAAPTAAQLSSCANPYEIQQYVSNLKKNNQEYDQLQNERKLQAGTQYATGNMMESEDGTGKHHFNDFIPQDALQKFQRLATGEPEAPKKPEIDMSNKGAQMMAKMGFTAGQGLGAQGTGVTSAVDAGIGNALKLGIGIAKETWEPQQGDDDFTLYRKRMMLGYKHRPNPLNNPRTNYY